MCDVAVTIALKKTTLVGGVEERKKGGWPDGGPSPDQGR